VDLFLFDVQENKELRSNEPTIERRNGQATVRQPPLRVMCSYLVTAWPVGGTEQALQEHRLLSQVLQELSRFSRDPTLLEPFLQGTLRGQEPPLPMHVSVADGLKGTAEFWTALHSPLRASLMVTVTFSMEVSSPETVPLAITSQIRPQLLTSEGLLNEASSFRIGGQVINAGSQPIAEADVAIVERNLTTKTDAGGYYTLGSVPSGSYTLQVQPSGATAQNFAITVPAIAGGNYNVRLT
jgi:hypothetical protein